MEQQSLGFALLNVWDWAHDPETDPPQKKNHQVKNKFGKTGHQTDPRYYNQDTALLTILLQSRSKKEDIPIGKNHHAKKNI